MSAPSKSPNTKSLWHFLHHNPKPKSSSIDSTLSLPLLCDSSDAEFVSISSCLSLSSTSGTNHEDLFCLSLDADKPSRIPLSLNQNPPHVCISRTRTTVQDGHQSRVGWSLIHRSPEVASLWGAWVDNLRMNALGKVVFQGLEQSSSSSSSFNGSLRTKYHGIECFYLANVRIAPILNDPICSLCESSKFVTVFDFGQLFSP